MKKQNFYHPKFIPTWILIACMKLGAKLPFAAQVFIGIAIGRALYPLLSRFRKIAFINISNCFPEKNLAEVQGLVKQHFEAIGISVFETANAYFAKSNKIQQLITVHNEHYLTAALEKKQRVILLTAHFTPLMLSSRALLLKHKIANIYRPQNNQLFNKIMCKSFVDNGAVMIKTKDIRGIVKAIKSGLVIWYAPDQDFRRKKRCFCTIFQHSNYHCYCHCTLSQNTKYHSYPLFFR